MSRAWRLLITGAGTGPQNMALDEALAESVRQGGDPFLRFYTWTPATLSLGRFQNLSDGLAPEALSLPRVRRSTGGGAIWHADELTYSLGCTQEDLGITGVKASFEKLGGALVQAWRSLGWRASFAKDRETPPSSLGSFTPACFAGAEEYDIVVEGKKLGGNAQRRDRLTIFQHGSIPLTLDHGLWERLFLPGFRPDPQSITDLRACGWTEGIPELIPVLLRSFQQTLGGTWRNDSPTPEERLLADQWNHQRYGNPGWTDEGGGRLRASGTDAPSATD